MSQRVRHESPPNRLGSRSAPNTVLRDRSASPRDEDRDADGASLLGITEIAAAAAAAAGKAAHSRDIPACDRCRSFKKKCSRTFPVCALCANAGQRCSFSTPVTSSNAETHHLRARVDWLTRYINDSLPVGASIDGVATGSDLKAVLSLQNGPSRGHQLGFGLPTTPFAGSTPGSSAAASPGALQARNGESGTDLFDRESVATNPGIRSIATISHDVPFSRPDKQLALSASPTAQQTHNPAPHDAAARRFVDAFFRNVNKAYPFVDRAKVLRSLDLLRSIPLSSGDAESTLLYLILAIGCTTLQRAGQIPSNTASKFDIPYTTIIQQCLAREDIESLQILVALALYSLFDPKGPSAWQIVGIASRKAVLLGLSRKGVDDDKDLSPADVELRRRLFWSIYVLDRMTAISLGHSVALIDDNMDVPLPGLTVEEFASVDKPHFISILQTNRHVIQLRQIEDWILREIHLKRHADVASISHADRRAILQDIRAKIEDWYSHGCLVSPLEPDNVPIHSSIAWQSARYYHLLVLLYYPCHFNSFRPVSANDLLRFVQKHLQSTSVLLEQQLLPLNRITLCRLFPTGLVLLQSFMASISREPRQHQRHPHNGSQPQPPSGPVAVRDELAVIIRVLETFPDEWVQAHRVAHIFRQFMAIASGASSSGGSLQLATPLYASADNSSSSLIELGMTRELCHAVLRPVMASLLSAMQEVLGRATCYASCEPISDQDADCAATQRVSDSNGGPLGYQAASSVRDSAPFTPVPNDEASSLGYDWGSVELGFI